MQSVPITTNTANSNPTQAIQHYLIKCVTDLRQVGEFTPCILVSSTNKTDHHDIAEILLKVALKNISQTKQTICISYERMTTCSICLHASFRSKSIHWFSRNQKNVSEWSNISVVSVQ
jgi:hypothetical protein